MTLQGVKVWPRWAAFAALLALAAAPALRGQEPPDATVDGGPSAVVPESADAGTTPDVAPDPAELEALEEDAGDLDATATEGLNLLRLFWQARWFMLPILAMSILVVAVTVERFLGLRRSRVLPPQLVVELGKLGGPRGGFDPRAAYRTCQRFPSAAANVIRAMLLKVGRPHSEVEHAVAEASEREAERMYANVRWLNLAAAVTPLMGLMGTVWGMIRAFHDTTLLAPGQNKADYLAEGIYLALVTTLGGLVVAIPAAILSHYFEGRVQSLFHQVDELLFNLMPQVERYEGRARFNRFGEEGNGSGSPAEPVYDESRPAAS